MKKIILLLLTFALFSCKKEKHDKCYMCQIVQNGIAHEQKMCGNADGEYKDAQGNNLQCVQIH